MKHDRTICYLSDMPRRALPSRERWRWGNTVLKCIISCIFISQSWPYKESDQEISC